MATTSGSVGAGAGAAGSSGSSVAATIRYFRPDLKGAFPTLEERKDSLTEREKEEWPMSIMLEHPVQVQNVRPEQERGELSLEQNGFVLTRHETKCPDFLDNKLVKPHYYPEIQEVVKRLTGAAEVVVIGHFARTDGWAEPGKRIATGYTTFVHIDYNNEYALRAPAMFARRAPQPQDMGGLGRQLTADDAERSYDFIYYNTWQPFDHEVLQHPLALLDARSIDRDQDFQLYGFAGHGDFRDISGHVVDYATLVAPNPNHRWCYFPRMQTNELLLFIGHRQRFVETEKSTRQCPHMAIWDATAPQGAPGRRSIETRVLAAFPKREKTEIKARL